MAGRPPGGPHQGGYASNNRDDLLLDIENEQPYYSGGQRSTLNDDDLMRSYDHDLDQDPSRPSVSYDDFVGGGSSHGGANYSSPGPSQPGGPAKTTPYFDRDRQYSQTSDLGNYQRYADDFDDGPTPLASPNTGGSQLPSRRGAALNGRLEQLQLSSLLVMMEMERKAGVLTLRALTGPSGAGTTGRIFLKRGQVVSAKLDDQPVLGGRECVYEMLTWQTGTFSFSAMEVDMEDTIKSSTTHLLMEGARLIDEANRDESL